MANNPTSIRYRNFPLFTFSLKHQLKNKCNRPLMKKPQTSVTTTQYGNINFPLPPKGDNGDDSTILADVYHKLNNLATKYIEKKLLTSKILDMQSPHP